MPRAEILINILWTVLFFAAALAFAIRMPELRDVVGDPQLGKPGAAAAFAFAATCGWGVSAATSWRRPRTPSRYRAVSTDAA